MTIEYAVDTKKKLNIAYKKIIKEAVELTAREENCPYEIEVSVTLTSNSKIKKINKEFRNIDKPTDVLSFPLCTYKKPSCFKGFEKQDDYFNPETGELMLGDIVLSVDKIISQAEKYGHSKKRELAFLVVHSMLHLFGYDHIDDKEREAMEAKQRHILDIGGITR